MMFLLKYSKVVYVKDVAFANRVSSPLPMSLIRINTACGDEVFKFDPFQSKYKGEATNWQSVAKDTLVFVNFGFLYPIRCYKPLGSTSQRWILLAQGDYMGKFPAYQFEGYNKKERQLLTENDYKFQIYSINGNSKRAISR
jgi:hypothetical protein